MLYHAATKTGVKADMARREAELEAKKKAHGMAQLKCDVQGPKLIVSLIFKISRTMPKCHTVSHIHSVKVVYQSVLLLLRAQPIQPRFCLPTTVHWIIDATWDKSWDMLSSAEHPDVSTPLHSHYAIP